MLDQIRLKAAGPLVKQKRPFIRRQGLKLPLSKVVEYNMFPGLELFFFFFGMGAVFGLLQFGRFGRYKYQPPQKSLYETLLSFKIVFNFV